MMNTTESRTASQLRALALRAAPATTAAPELAARVLARRRASRRRRRLVTGAGALVLAGAVAAAGFSGSDEYRLFTQPSAAMEPTVAVGQTVVVGEEIAPQRGDVVLVQIDDSRQTVESLSRVIGLPGDTVSCPARPDGTCAAVVVSGRPLKEPWLTRPTAAFRPVAVRPGEVFLLGDARDVAADSRVLGPRPADAVLGVVVARITADGRREPRPGTPPHAVPGSGVPVDPAGRVPSAPAAPGGG